MIKLECVLCTAVYTEHDVAILNFFPATRVCWVCYRKLQKSPFKVSCFGKKSKDGNLGFDNMAVECREYCPDRRLCPKFANKDLIKLHKQLKTEVVVTEHKEE